MERQKLKEEDLLLNQKQLDEKYKIAHVLASYFYFPRRTSLEGIFRQYKNKNVNIMIDSGIFTFRKHVEANGLDPDMDLYMSQYIDFLNSNADIVNLAVTIDHPHDAESIIKNTDYIYDRLDKRITLVPVIQSFEFNEKQIEYTLEKYDFICLGTYDGKHKAIMYNDEVAESLKPIFKLNKKYNKILHGLGRTRVDWLENNPVDSSDSSAWARFIITGNTPMWDEKAKMVVNFPKETRYKLLNYEDYYIKRFGKSEIEIVEYFKEKFNKDISELSEQERLTFEQKEEFLTEKTFYDIIRNKDHLYSDTYPHQALCALAYICLQDEIRKTNPNYRLHYATSNINNFKAHNMALDLFYNRNF
jgi:hypothetical protein